MEGAVVEGVEGVIPEEILKFITAFPSLSIRDEFKKVRCSLTGHEMPYRLAELEKYINGSKYRKAQERSKFGKYQPHIVPSTKRGKKHQLFCTLTVRHINRVPQHVERHVRGRKYKKALERYEECQKLGIKFKPLRKNQKRDDEGAKPEEAKKYSRSATSDTSESEAESDDSLSDLYPREDFPRLEADDPDMAVDDDDSEDGNDDEEDSDFDVESMDCGTQEVNGAASRTEVQSVAKRKKNFQRGARKKAVKHPQDARIPIQKAFAKKRPLKQPKKETR